MSTPCTCPPFCCHYDPRGRWCFCVPCEAKANAEFRAEAAERARFDAECSDPGTRVPTERDRLEGNQRRHDWDRRKEGGR